MEGWEGSELNQAKEILAFELTKLVHGEEEATTARESARALFSQGSAAQMPTAELSEEDFTDGKIELLSLLVKAGLVPSRSEARRNVEQGGVTVNGDKLTDLKAVLDQSLFRGEGAIVKRGKKSFRKVIVK